FFLKLFRRTCARPAQPTRKSIGWAQIDGEDHQGVAVFRSSQNSGRRATSPFTDYWHCLNIPTFRRSFGTRIWRWDRMQSEVEYEYKNQLLPHRFDGHHVGDGIR